MSAVNELRRGLCSALSPRHTKRRYVRVSQRRTLRQRRGASPVQPIEVTAELEPDDQRFVRHDSSPGLARELGMGIGFVAAVAVGRLALSALPFEFSGDPFGGWQREPPKVEEATAVGSASPCWFASGRSKVARLLSETSHSSEKPASKATVPFSKTPKPTVARCLIHRLLDASVASPGTTRVGSPNEFPRRRIFAPAETDSAASPIGPGAHRAPPRGASGGSQRTAGESFGCSSLEYPGTSKKLREFAIFRSLGESGFLYRDDPSRYCFCDPPALDLWGTARFFRAESPRRTPKGSMRIRATRAGISR